MDKKIKVKVEKEEMRLSIPYGDEMIIINEINPQFKTELLKFIVDILQEGKDFDEKKLFMDVVDRCTNVEFDGNLFETQYVSHEIQMLVNEIMIMLQEVIQEAYQMIRLALQQAKNEMTQNEVVNETAELIESVKEQEEQNEEMKEEKIEVKKPHKPVRGRRVMK